MTDMTNDGEGLDSNDGVLHIAGEPLNLSDILAHMNNEAPVEPLDPAEARSILRAAFTSLATVTTFRPGDLIRRKPGLYTGTNDLRGGVAVFVRFCTAAPMTYAPLDAGAPVAMVDEDCIIAVVIPSGEVSEHFACARYYEPAPAITAVA